MTSVLKIGRTNYYSVRKGTQQYCVAEGKKLQDAEYCWQAMKDPESGKTFFISGSGVRRWHLPDIHLTERERLEEERELKFRREQKALEDTRLAKQKAGDAALLENSASPAASPSSTEDDATQFAARDRAAMNAVLLSGWETPEQRRPVTRFVKSVLQSHVTQRLLDEKVFAQLVTTITREHCSTKPPPFNPEQEAALRESALSAAKQRVDDERRRSEYEKLTEELKDKVRRLEAERRKMQAQIDTMSQAEEKMKDELFALRAHKQDTLLTGFKRLTRVGLINAYWERWVKYKTVVDAQLHIKARERRQVEMSDRVREMENKIKDLQETNATLRNRVQQMHGRDVVATLMNTHGKSIIRRFYAKWKAFAETSVKEKEYFKVRQMLIDCPTCKLQGIQTERVYERLALAVDDANRLRLECASSVEERERVTNVLQAAQAHVAIEQHRADDASRLLVAAQHRIKQLTVHAAGLDERCRVLGNELQRLAFETEQFHKPRDSEDVRDTLLTRTEGLAMPAGGKPMAHFFESEASRFAELAHNRILKKSNAGVIPIEPSRSGAILSTTEVAIAPRVFSERPQNPLSHVEKAKAAVAEILKKESSISSSPPPLSSRSARLLNAMPARASSQPQSESSSSSSSRSSSTSSDTSSSSSNSSAPPSVDDQRQEVPLPTPDGDDERCPRCRFSKKLTPFCPVDGSRHMFVALSRHHADPGGAVQRNYDSAFRQVGAAGSMSLSASFASAQRPNSRRAVLSDGNVMSLPPPRGSGNPRREEVSTDAIAETNVLPHTAALRASLSLDATKFKPVLFQSQLGVPIGEVSTDTRAATREVADYIRSTQLVTAANLHANGGRNGSGALARRNLQEESYPALSLDARMFSKPPDQTSGSRWGSIFDASDTTSGLGPDTLFGVYRRDELAPESHEAVRQREFASSTNNVSTGSTPNMVLQAYRR